MAGSKAGAEKDEAGRPSGRMHRPLRNLAAGTISSACGLPHAIWLALKNELGPDPRSRIRNNCCAHSWHLIIVRIAGITNSIVAVRQYFIEFSRDGSCNLLHPKRV